MAILKYFTWGILSGGARLLPAKIYLQLGLEILKSVCQKYIKKANLSNSKEVRKIEVLFQILIASLYGEYVKIANCL